MARRLRRQFSDQLQRCGFAARQASKQHSHAQMHMCCALIGSVLSPDILWGVHDGSGRAPTCYNRANNEVK